MNIFLIAELFFSDLISAGFLGSILLKYFYDQQDLIFATTSELFFHQSIPNNLIEIRLHKTYNTSKKLFFRRDNSWFHK